MNRQILSQKQAVLRRWTVWGINCLAVAICAGLIIGGVVLFLQGTAAVAAHEAEAVFTREQAGGMLRLFLLPAVLLAVLLIAAALMGRKQTKREWDGRPMAALDQATPICARQSPNARRTWLALAIAAGLIAAGIWNGGLRDVLIKAINICTECIGLG